MKLRVVIDIDASSTIIETIQRNGFNLEKIGTGFQCKQESLPTIPRRKIKIKFIKDPTTEFDEFCNQKENEIAK